MQEAIRAALKEGKFEWRKVGQFYQTMVLPYVGGYLTLYVVIGLIPELEGVLGDGLALAALSFVVATLGGSIFANFARLELFKNHVR